MFEPANLATWSGEARLRDARHDERPLVWPAWLWPLLAWVPLEQWHARFARELPALGGAALAGAPASPAALAGIATGVVVAFALAEAGFYGMLWAARGRRLPFWATTVAVLQAGLFELAALQLLDAHPAPAPAWVAWLAGVRALGVRSAFAVALGGAGLLALARGALFAGLQAGLVRRPWREAFALVIAGWVASHVAAWWLAELFRGRSFFG